ncbi:MAG: hypothetical protein AAFN51_14005 [Pseudomonadota bacterium]
MTGLETKQHWSEQAKTLCRIYQSLQPALSDLPGTDQVELARMIATDLVFKISAVRETDANVEDALTSISAVCQSCAFERTVSEPTM